MPALIKYIHGIAVCSVLLSAAPGQELQPRSAFDVPLTKMTLAADDEEEQFRRVKVQIDENKVYALITRGHDMLIKNNRGGTEKSHFQESPDRSFIISNFEAEQISRVITSFVTTLDLFEKDLKRKRWDRCLYLDGYFPRFLKRFYYLVCAARNSSHAMPRISRIPDSDYDVSVNSPKSDQRIKNWQEQPDHILKMRIISKELSFQLKAWQKKELDNARRNEEIAYSAKAEEAYGLFIRMYFNIQPIPYIPTEGSHL